MNVDTHLMALLSSLHGAVVFFAGCFFGMRWGRGPQPKAPPPPPVVKE
jgi:hypothetical protein